MQAGFEGCRNTKLAGMFKIVRTLDDQHKGKMWLLHYQDNVVENWEEWNDRAQRDGFKGFLKKGQIIEVDSRLLPEGADPALAVALAVADRVGPPGVRLPAQFCQRSLIGLIVASQGFIVSPQGFIVVSQNSL